MLHILWFLYILRLQYRGKLIFVLINRWGVNRTVAALGRLATEARAEKQPEVTARIAGMHVFLQEMHGWYQQMSKLPPNTLRSLVNLGAGVTKWLPSQHKAKGKK